MSRVEFKISEFTEAKDKCQTATDRMNDIVGEVSTSNRGLLETQSGLWADATYTRGIQLETDARMFWQAMSRLTTCFGELITDGTNIGTARTNFLSAFDASPNDADYVMCTSDADIAGNCNQASASLDDLRSKVQTAMDAVGKLKDTGGIQGPLQTGLTDITAAKTKVLNASTRWTTLVTWVNAFETKFSNTNTKTSPYSMAPNGFITESMVTNTQNAMDDISEGLLGAAFSAGKGVKDTVVGGFKINTWRKLVEKVASAPIADIDPKKAGQAFEEICGYFHTVGLPNDLAGARDGLCEIGTFNSSVFGSLLSVQRTTLSAVGKKFLGDINVIGSLKQGVTDSWAGFKQLVSGQAAKAADSADDIAESLAGAEKGMTRLQGAGKFIKGGAKALGAAFDIFSLGDAFMTGKQAYDTTVGDSAQKTAAATVMGGRKVLKWGVGKAVGAVVGSVCLGPVGAVVGIAVGSAVDFAIDAGFKAADDSGFTQTVTDGLATMIRGGGSQYALGGSW